MNINKKNILLLIAITIIAGAIWYIERSKPPAVVGTPIAVSGNSISFPISTSTPVSSDRSAILKQKAATYPPAVELIPDGKFINAEPFKLKDFIGKKVVLIDFWTYTCINCLRSQPYLNAWYGKYKNAGLVIVGVHSPEFDFEKDYNNVVQAIHDTYHVQYPVMQDNDHATWDAYQNQYWPAEYLIDIDGYIVHHHFGEGSYDDTERAIQAALKERDKVLGLSDTVPTSIVNPSDVTAVNFKAVQSPETYFGAARNEHLGNGTKGVPGPQTLSLPAVPQSNTLYLGGSWNFKNEYAENTTVGARIQFKYNAKNIYFVAAADTPVTIMVKRDGQVISAERGKDVAQDGTTIVQANRLYHLIQEADYQGEHTLEIDIQGVGLKAFTFTFG